MYKGYVKEGDRKKRYRGSNGQGQGSNPGPHDPTYVCK